jgi:hypothetical protein
MASALKKALSTAFLGQDYSSTIPYYSIRMKEISTSIEKTLTIVMDACTFSPKIDCQFECFAADC